MKRVLIVGDGNMSYSYAYFQTQKDSILKLITTCYDSKELLCSKYPETQNILFKLLQEDKVQFVANVDACMISSSTWNTHFDEIIFNHPHVGIEDIHRHRILLSHFLFGYSNLYKKQTLLY